MVTVWMINVGCIVKITTINRLSVCFFSSSPPQETSLFLLNWSIQTPSLPSSTQTQTPSPPPSNRSTPPQTAKTRLTASASSLMGKYQTCCPPRRASTATPTTASRALCWTETWVWWPRRPSPSPRARSTDAPPCSSASRRLPVPTSPRGAETRGPTELTEKRTGRREMKTARSWAPNPSCQWSYPGWRRYFTARRGSTAAAETARRREERESTKRRESPPWNDLTLVRNVEKNTLRKQQLDITGNDFLNV